MSATSSTDGSDILSLQRTKVVDTWQLVHQLEKEVLGFGVYPAPELGWDGAPRVNFSFDFVSDAGLHDRLL